MFGLAGSCLRSTLSSRRPSLSLSAVQCLSVCLCPSFCLPHIPLQAEWGSVNLATSKTNSTSECRRGPLVVSSLRGHSLPRIKGWELICKPAKPETMIGFPFCSFDTDLNMRTKWANSIYIKVSRSLLSHRSVLHCVFSQVVKLICFFLKDFPCSERTDLSWNLIPDGGVLSGFVFLVAVRRWCCCSWSPSGQEETQRCGGSRHGCWGTWSPCGPCPGLSLPRGTGAGQPGVCAGNPASTSTVNGNVWPGG